MSILVYDASIASIVAFGSYVFWVSSVPPTPPASKTETKRQLPWIRLHAITNTIVVCTCMMLTAYRALIGGLNSDALILKDICPPSARHAPFRLPITTITGYCLLFVGGYIRLTSQRTLGQYFTWEIALKKGHRLCTIGPYSIVRHPGYLGLWCVRISIDIIQSCQGSVLTDCLYPRYPLPVTLFVWQNYFFTLALFVWMYFRMKWEDDLLRKEFSVEWKKWEEQTPYRVLPFIY